jgi:hypothetical protein
MRLSAAKDLAATVNSLSELAVGFSYTAANHPRPPKKAL